jgi:hypothetical protein
MGISTISVRVGKKYRLINNGEKTDFQVLEILSDKNFIIKDLTTLDVYEFERLTYLGKGSDYLLEEI